jgi:ketosteroid isomerase-like protein
MAKVTVVRAPASMIPAYNRSVLICCVLILLTSVAYSGSYQRTRDGQTLVWRDVPARGDEATWSGKRDKEGFATGSGVLTWYKTEPSIVTGSNIMDTRRYVTLINHYSGTMVRGKFKGAVNDLEATGKRFEANSRNETSRASRRKRASRSPSSRVKAARTLEPTPTPHSEPIIVDTPERTSTVATPTPAAEQSSAPIAEEAQTAEPLHTSTFAAEGMAETPEPVQEQNPRQTEEGSQNTVSSETAALAENETTAPLEAAQNSPPGGEQQQSSEPPQTGTLVAKRMTTPPSDQETRQADAPATSAAPTSTPLSPDKSLRAMSRAPMDLPKPARDIDEETVARLDVLYQSAVKANDAAIMDEILSDDFVLETDSGTSLTKADLIKEAQEKRTIYEDHAVEKGTQKVRIWRDTAVVTGLLKVKGTKDNNTFDYQLSVSETYVRTPTGWRYVFGQASRPEAK